MKTWIAAIAALVAGMPAAPATAASPTEALYGVWEPIEYRVAGETIPLRGLMIVTPGYFAGKTTFDMDGDGARDANANAGPIEIRDGTIHLQQWMQLHWRSAGDGSFLKEDVPEDIPYEIDGDRLTFHFPSGNSYLSRRLE